MDKNAEKQMTEAVEKQLRRTFSDGLKQGSKAICGVILEEIASTNKTADEKIGIIQEFCKNSLGLA